MAVALIVLAALGFSSCGDDEADSAPSSSEPSAATVEDESAPKIDETFRVGSPKQQLAIRCWGSGEPAVVLDAGSTSGGIETFGALRRGPDQAVGAALHGLHL